MVLIILIVCVIGVALWIFSVYNRLVALLNRAQNAFGQIDVQLKRRYDLIPNLVEVAKKYMNHEEQTLVKVIQARNDAKSVLDFIDGKNLEQIARLSTAEGNLNGMLRGFNIAVEAYPELKANETMMQLNEEIASSENKIAFARQAYNDSVMNYNTYKQSFPNNMVVGIFARFHKDLDILTFDESPEVLNKAPKVQF